MQFKSVFFMEGHIYIYGEISRDWGVGVADVQRQINGNKEADTLIVHINSPGGDVYEGFAIHDILKSQNKTIITQVEGICASIASVVFFAGSERLMTENSELMIHNPFGFSGGTAEQMQKYTEQLKSIEDKLVNFYVEATGLGIDEVKSMMNAETFLTTQEAIDKKFATGIIDKIKAVAKLNINLNQKLKMEDEKLKGFMNKFEAMFNNLAKKFGFKALMLADAEGKNLDFGEQVTEASELAVGMTAKYEDGTIPTGEVTMPDGTVLTFDETGTITAITEPSEPDEIEALKTENSSLKAEIEQLKSAQAKIENDFKAKMTNIKAEMKSELIKLVEEKPEKGGEVVNRFAN